MPITPTNQFKVKLKPSTPYNFTIYWGDGQSEIFNETTSSVENDASITHTYDNPGIYNIRISENIVNGFKGVYFNGINALGTGFDEDSVKITDILRWGDFDLNDISRAFSGCKNLSAVSTTDNNTLSSVANFTEAFEWNYITSYPKINTSGATTLREAWRLNYGLKSFPEIDSSNVEDFYGAWNYCLALTAFPLIDTSSGTNFDLAWTQNRLLKDFPEINTSSGNTFVYTWYNCKELSAFPLIDTSNGTDFSNTWWSCVNLSATDFPTLNMSKMTNGGNCFQNVTLTTNSYSTLLSSICATNLNTGVQFHGGNSKRNAIGTEAYVHLTDERGWSINDGGPE